ncbi:neuronal PAS domain-containing protein 4-like [Egretta garzetta]|uniref:neuronal PAS domain-containing protein 4-like n=1 Tax=Egretta garzetta TaxID=188379 RepID=UPI00163D38C4|nr:neuronal PAS domain-containing protein 4-like [Egretta garzetta]
MALHWPASPSTAAFLAFCTPVAQLPADGDAGSQDDLFQSTHNLDMTFTDVTESVIYHLGYRREELIGQSWYSLLHPEDADLAAAQHRAVGECQAWEHSCLPPARCGSLLRKARSSKLVTRPIHHIRSQAASRLGNMGTLLCHSTEQWDKPA